MEVVIDNSFGKGKITHARNKDTKNRFSYSAPYLLLDLKKLPLSQKIFSCNRFNLFSISNMDHGYRVKEKSIIQFCNDIATKHKIKFEHIMLLSIPKIIGYAFNPISFYLYLDKSQKLIAVIYEVKNTHGDQIHYLDFNNFKNKKFKKNMYVSPFIEMESHYEISLNIKNFNYFKCNIQQFDLNFKNIFFASLDVKLNSMKEKSLLSFFVKNIFSTFKVILLIHYQSMKLFLKKSKFFSHVKNLNNRVNVE